MSRQTSVARFLRNQFPEADLSGIPDGPARILVAGCGTGRHPIGTARRFPDSSVLAVDLSLTSLAYALRKTRELGIGNIEYRQADLLALGALAERFDVVDCTGVLHHLEDPVAGFRVLRSLLRPGGVMRVGLYSEMARRHVVRAREFIAERGFAPTPAGIRACRAAILAQQDDPLARAGGAGARTSTARADAAISSFTSRNIASRCRGSRAFSRSSISISSGSNGRTTMPPRATAPGFPTIARCPISPTGTSSNRLAPTRSC